MPFEPKGEKSESEKLYEHLVRLEPGDIITYGQITEILGRDLANNRSCWYAAVRRLERVNSATMVNIPKVGYQRISAARHENVATHHYRKSRRQVAKAIQKIDSANRNELDDVTARRFEEIQRHLATQASIMRRFEREQKKQKELLEKAVDRIMKGDREIA